MWSIFKLVIMALIGLWLMLAIIDKTSNAFDKSAPAKIPLKEESLGTDWATGNEVYRSQEKKWVRNPQQSSQFIPIESLESKMPYRSLDGLNKKKKVKKLKKKIDIEDQVIENIDLIIY